MDHSGVIDLQPKFLQLWLALETEQFLEHKNISDFLGLEDYLDISLKHYLFKFSLKFI